jgi:hypothetical protein
MDSIEEFVKVSARKAQIAYRDGATYVGPVKKRARHGENGVLQTDECVYTGRWNEGDFEFGTLLIRNDEQEITLKGSFHEGCLNDAAGTEQGPNYTFEGAFVDGVKHGKGKMIFSCSCQIDGCWKNGKLTGESMVLFPDGQLRMRVWFSDGVFETAKVGRKTFGKQGEFPGAQVRAIVCGLAHFG